MTVIRMKDIEGYTAIHERFLMFMFFLHEIYTHIDIYIYMYIPIVYVCIYLYICIYIYIQEQSQSLSHSFLRGGLADHKGPNGFDAQVWRPQEVSSQLGPMPKRPTRSSSRLGAGPWICTGGALICSCFENNVDSFGP